MKTNGRINELRAIECLNDHEYGIRVVWPLLDYLGIPSDMRRPQFQIENPFGGGLLRLDFLVHVGDIPMVTIENEPRAHQFDQGLKQAKNYSTNFKPRQRGSVIREMTVPFLMVAAGNKVHMLRAVARGLNIEYEPILEDGQPAFLEWTELLAEAQRIAGPVGEDQPVLKADAAQQFFDDLYRAVDSAPGLRKKDDLKIILFNKIIELARRAQKRRIRTECGRAGLSERAQKKVLKALAWYEQKVVANEFAGPAVARGYRNFLLQPGGHGRHQYFTGESQHRPYKVRGRLRYRNVARYFTPTEIIQQMVRLAQPRAADRVIDMTCGSGGFLAECVDFVAQKQGDENAQDFLTKRLVGIDDDPFCISCSRSLLAFLYPQHANDLQVYLHNCLYQNAPAGTEISEDSQAEAQLAPGLYDVVIGNPPGNDEYSGTNAAFIAQQWAERFGQHDGGLMDHHCFIRRAIELAHPEGGRVCLLVPEGLLSRDNRGIPRIRREIMRDCELRAVISLPRVFKNNNAQMAILFLICNPQWNRNHKVLMATIRPTWKDENGQEQPTDLFAELESIVDRYQNELTVENQALSSGEGLRAFPSAMPEQAQDAGTELD
jgi:hypothetical protein